jgi:hypothetical protein
VLYSNRDALYPTGPGVRVYVLNNGALGVETSNGTTSRNVESAAGVIADGTWYHIAATLSSSTGLSLFVDGAARGAVTGATPFAASSSTAWAGAEREGPGAAIDRFNGIIDEIRVSNTRRY